MARSMPESATQAYLPLLRMAADRELLKSDARKTAARLHIEKEIFPVQSGDAIKYFEYLLNIEIKRRKGEYADFLRALTPLTVDLMWNILKKQCGIDPDKYTYISKRDGGKRWDRHKLAGSEVDDTLQEAFSYDFKYGPVYSSSMEPLIKRFASDDAVKEAAQNLRKIDSVRNTPAHEMLCYRRIHQERNRIYKQPDCRDIQEGFTLCRI